MTILTLSKHNRLIYNTILIGLLSFFSVFDAEAKFSKREKHELSEIIKTYLMENPDILRAALDNLETKEKQDQFTEIISDARDFSIGPEDASIVMVEYFDYRCTYCKASMDWVLNQIDIYGDNIRIIFKEFPILSADSERAARAALAAAKQGKYIEMHQALMQHRGGYSDNDLVTIAKRLDLNSAHLLKNMNSPEINAHLLDIRQAAFKMEIGATPTFVLNGNIISGFNPDAMNMLIKDASE